MPNIVVLVSVKSQDALNVLRVLPGFVYHTEGGDDAHSPAVIRVHETSISVQLMEAVNGVRIQDVTSRQLADPTFVQDMAEGGDVKCLDVTSLLNLRPNSVSSMVVGRSVNILVARRYLEEGLYIVLR